MRAALRWLGPFSRFDEPFESECEAAHDLSDEETTAFTKELVLDDREVGAREVDLAQREGVFVV